MPDTALQPAITHDLPGVRASTPADALSLMSRVLPWDPGQPHAPMPDDMLRIYLRAMQGIPSHLVQPTVESVLRTWLAQRMPPIGYVLRMARTVGRVSAEDCWARVQTWIHHPERGALKDVLTRLAHDVLFEVSGNSPSLWLGVTMPIDSRTLERRQAAFVTAYNAALDRGASPWEGEP
jgi:hypothetical protein